MAVVAVAGAAVLVVLAAVVVLARDWPDHIRLPSHSYSVRIRVWHSATDVAVGGAPAAVDGAPAAAGAAPQRDSWNEHWQSQEARRSSVKARCSGRQVEADEGDGAQRQRSGPGVYFGRLLKIARMQLPSERRRGSKQINTGREYEKSN